MIVARQFTAWNVLPGYHRPVPPGRKHPDLILTPMSSCRTAAERLLLAAE